MAETSRSPEGASSVYRTIVVDPPWDHSDGTGVNFQQASRVTHLPYETMSLDEIRALPVESFAASAAHLYLWTTSRYLPCAFSVISAWGFRYSATLVWCKPERGWTVGGTFPNNVEFVLFCTRRVGGDRVLTLTAALADRAQEIGVTRGDVDKFMGTSDMGGWWLSRLPHRCACPTDEQWVRLKELLRIDAPDLDVLVADINGDKGEKTSLATASGRWFRWNRGAHSQKPEAFLDIVERVSPGPYLEMFARRNRLGWDTWGNEALNHIEVGA